MAIPITFPSLTLSTTTTIIYPILLLPLLLPLIITLVFLIRVFTRGFYHHVTFLRHLPRPTTSAYSLLTRIYARAPEETARWLNLHGGDCDGNNPLTGNNKPSLLYVIGPLFFSNVIVLSSSAVREMTRTVASLTTVSTSPCCQTSLTVPVSCYPRADSFVGILKSYTGDTSIFAAKGLHHLRLRRLLSAPLSHEHITTYLHQSFFARGFQLATRLLSTSSSEDTSQGCEPLETVRKATFSVVTDACFGNGFLTDQEHDQLFTLYDAALSMKPGVIVARVLLTGFPVSVPFHWFARSERAKLELRAIVQRMCVRLLSSTKTTTMKTGRRDNDDDDNDDDDNDGNTKSNGDQSLLRHMLLSTTTATTTRDDNDDDDDDKATTQPDSGRTTTSSTSSSSTHNTTTTTSSSRRRIDDTVPLSTDELTDAVLSFLLAGQATSGIAVCWVLYLLAKHPHWQTRLFSELHQCQNQNLDDLDRLPILDAIVRETLRLFPPLSTAMRKVAHPTATGVTLQGYFLPNETIVRVPLLALHTNEAVWGKDAWTFNPDRWLSDDAEVVEEEEEGSGGRRKQNKGDHRFMWATFWFGSQSCIGHRFAMLEIKAFVMAVVGKCRIAVDEVRDKPPTRWGVDTTPVGMKLYLSKRDDNSGGDGNGS